MMKNGRKIEISVMSELQNCHALVSRHHLVREREKIT